MFDQTLYLAVLRTKTIDAKLQQTNPKLLSLLELEEIEANGKRYIGKKTPSFPNIEQLGNLESHLQSVMQRLEITGQAPCLVSHHLA